MNQNPILLVEDKPDDEALALRAFRKSEIRNAIVVARDGVEALEYLFPCGQPQGCDAASLPAVVLLDLKLPRVDGLEVLRRIRAQASTRFIPVVILTSSREEQDLISAYTLGANSYVRKPVDFVEFAQTVSHLGLYWLSLNELP